MAKLPVHEGPRLHVQRRVLVGPPEAPKQLPLADLRHLPAYVLLGDPGSGKSAAFLHEAANTANGKYVRAIDVPNLADLPFDVVLFVDGLDEARAGLTGVYEPLTTLKQRLRDLRIERFRIACRAADWIGQADQHDFSSLLPSGELSIAQLLPMAESELAPLIVEFGEPDPQTFLTQVHQRQLEGLLQNPMSLKLLVSATQSGWPSSKEPLYQLACQQLVRETNPDHKVRTSRQRPKFDALINAASEICALLLLSGNTAINLQSEPTSSDVIEFDKLPGHASSAAATQRTALGTRLFATRLGLTDTVEPVHRTVAEYLAAKHLSGLLDANPGLPALRLSALFGPGGQVATPLRGLNAWLATVNTTHRRRFIGADPLGVALYGDASTFTAEDKQFLFERLAAEAQKTPHFRMGSWQQSPDISLASSDMAGYFRATITSSNRSAEHLALVDWVFDLLECAGQLIGLDNEVLAAVRDVGLPDDVRSAGLSAWLASNPSAEAARALLADLSSASPQPAPMIARVARCLYPGALSLKEALRYLPQQSQHDQELWQHRWGRHVAEKTPDNDLEAAIDAMLNCKPRAAFGVTLPGEDGSPDLLARLVRLRGTSAPPHTLCRWLSLGVDPDSGQLRTDWQGASALREVQTWLVEHPDAYIAAAASLIGQTPSNVDNSAWTWLWSLHSRLLDARPPTDFVRRILDIAASTRNSTIAEWALIEASHALVTSNNCKGLSLEYLDEWCARVAKHHTEVMSWRERAFTTPWSRVEQNRSAGQYRVARQKEVDRAKASWIDLTRRQVASLREGQAPAALLGALSMAWKGRFHEVTGNDGNERLLNFLNHDAILFDAAHVGLAQAHWRDDLPTVKEILTLELQGQRHTIADPSLLGADLESAKNADAHWTWPNDLAARLLAFLFTHGTGDDPRWFDALIDSRPDCVAEVYLAYLLGRVNAGQSYVHMGHRLTDDPAFAPIAARVVLPALQAWPTRCTADQRPTLMQVHDAAWAYMLPADMDLLAQERLRLRSLDVVQRTHWQLVQALRSKSHATLHRLLATARQSGAVHAALLHWVAMPGMRTQLDDVEQMPLERQSELWMALAEPIKPARWPRDAATGWLHAVAGNPSPAATRVLQGWLSSASLQAWHATVRALLYQQQAICRDAQHTMPLIQDVAATLQCGGPANAADLAAMVLDQLDQLNQDLLGADTPIWKNFWRTVSVKKALVQEPKIENLCRDQIKQYLEPRLSALHVSIGKEVAKVDESRCDLQVSHWTERGRELRVPVEIKRAFHPDLWTAIRNQLIDRYALDPASSGHGIYLVLWFGADKAWLKPHLERLPIHNALDLQRVLTDTVPDALRQHIRVKVLDVSAHIEGPRR